MSYSPLASQYLARCLAHSSSSINFADWMNFVHDYYSPERYHGFKGRVVFYYVNYKA